MSDYSRRNTTGGSGTGDTTSSDRTTPPAGLSAASSRIISSVGPLELFRAETPTIEALAEFQINGYYREHSGKMNIIEKSNEAINIMGFSITSIEELSPGIDTLKNYSLIGSTNIDETIRNSNIVDPDLNKLTPIKTTATDKFKSASDPFYELDQERPESIKIISETEMNKMATKTVITKIAYRLAPAIRFSPNKMLKPKTDRGPLRK